MTERKVVDTKEAVRLRAVEVSSWLGVSRSTLAKWRMNGNGPPFHRLGPRLVYYIKSEVESWLDSCDQPTKPARPRTANS
jgi:predicted DNA-binding transcriptional regulator AlpA